MKILQLIDTLNPGGAEKMAVTYANSLSDFGIKSYLVSTRGKGKFLNNIKGTVVYNFLNRKSLFDLIAIRKLIKLIKEEKIDIVHAHGTSWFIAVICKILAGNFVLIWHNHSGNSLNMSILKRFLLSYFSIYFNAIISVNIDLLAWGKKYLRSTENLYLPNFVTSGKLIKDQTNNKFKIACISNLRKEKNHLLLLHAADRIKSNYDLEIHFIGRDQGDAYSEIIKREFAKRNHVMFHESVVDPNGILSQMDLGILVSRYEGMPMAILEYGAAGIPVIATDVGNCSELIGVNGIVIPSDNLERLVKAIETYLEESERAKLDAENLKKSIMSKFSSKVIIPQYLNFCNDLCLKL
jgi:glycosyltransferase involved in cell wall biosynthesis